MNWKTIVPLVIALGLGGIAAKVGKDMMAKGRQGDVKTIKVVSAKEDLSPGAMIKETDVVLRELPAAAVSEHSFANLSDLVGRVVTAQVSKGQPVLETLLAPKGALGGAQAMVPEGMRAVSLEVNEFSGVAGLLTPGSHVDIVQTMRGKDDTQAMAKTIVENLTVIAVGRRMSTAAPVAVPGATEGEGSISRSVTLLATAEQAEAIDLASHTGSPRLVLRNGMDSKMTGGKGVTVAELRGTESSPVETQAVKPESVEPTKAEPTKAEPVKAADYREIEVIRAGAATTVRVSVPGADAVAGTHERLGTLPKE